MNQFLALLLFSVSLLPATAQPSAQSASPAAGDAIATYHQAVATQKEVYTGREHVGYLPGIEGTAYFVKDWQKGTVAYNGIVYENELLLYDLAGDKLVLKRPDGFAIELRAERTSYFTLAADTFVYVGATERNALRPGFYQQLAQGAILLLARHTKEIEEKAEGAQLRQRFSGKTSFYAVKDAVPHTIKNSESLLALTGSKRNEIQQHLKKGKIRFRKDPVQALTIIAERYNKTGL